MRWKKTLLSFHCLVLFANENMGIKWSQVCRLELSGQSAYVTSSTFFGWASTLSEHTHTRARRSLQLAAVSCKIDTSENNNKLNGNKLMNWQFTILYFCESNAKTSGTMLYRLCTTIMKYKQIRQFYKLIDRGAILCVVTSEYLELMWRCPRLYLPG